MVVKNNYFLIKALVMEGLFIAGCKHENTGPQNRGVHPGGNSKSGHLLNQLCNDESCKDGIAALLGLPQIVPEQTHNHYLKVSA